MNRNHIGWRQDNRAARVAPKGARMSDFPNNTKPQQYRRFAGLTITAYYSHLPLTIGTAHGVQDVKEGTWIATDIACYPYPITDDIFRKTYVLAMTPPARIDAAAIDRLEEALRTKNEKGGLNYYENIAVTMINECRALTAELELANYQRLEAFGKIAALESGQLQPLPPCELCSGRGIIESKSSGCVVLTNCPDCGGER